MSRAQAIQILAEKGTAILKCNGNSMRPIMAPGDSLYIQKIDTSLLCPGDIVFCRIHGNLQVHLLSAIDNQRFQISNNKGHINGWISSSAIFGLCVQVNDKVLISSDQLALRK